jgi:hypothetical protein
MMKTRLLVLIALCCASCSSASQGMSSGLPAFDPTAYVTMPKDPSVAKRTVQLINLPPDDPARARITEPLENTLEKLGRPGVACLAIEIRERGLKSPDCIYYVQNHPDDALLCPSLFEKLVKWKSEGTSDRPTLAFLNKGMVGMKTPADQQLYLYVDCLIRFGRNAVPYLRECLKSGDPVVRQIAWDLLNLLAFNSLEEGVYQEALQRATKESTDWKPAADSFGAWWDENRLKVGWIPEKYSFRAP